MWLINAIINLVRAGGIELEADLLGHSLHTWASVDD